MTNKEALISVLMGISVEENTLEKVLIDADINPLGVYSKSAAEAIDRCAIPVLETLLSQANISEGGYSVSFDRTAVRARLDKLEEKYGISTGPTIRRVSPW